MPYSEIKGVQVVLCKNLGGALSQYKLFVTCSRLSV